MVRHKTSALVESGILAAIAVIFTLIGNYVPVLDVIVNVLWPLPIILCGRRNGLMWSFLCLMVTGAVVAILISPLQALTQVLILGLVGLIMGEGMRRQLSPVQVLVWGSVGAFLSFVLSGLAAYFLMNINVIEEFFTMMNESFSMTGEIYETLGIQNEEVLAQMKTMQHMLGLVLPAGILLSAPITAFVNYWAARKVLARLGDHYPWFPSFDQWKLPRWILGIYATGMVLVVYFKSQDASLGFRVGYTCFTVSNVMLMLQGLSMVLWYVRYRGVPRFLFPLSVFLSFFVPIAAQFLVVMGAFEMVLDPRHVRK
jgi:uncharacterized protein YybS (DUF2232 family)